MKTTTRICFLISNVYGFLWGAECLFPFITKLPKYIQRSNKRLYIELCVKFGKMRRAFLVIFIFITNTFKGSLFLWWSFFLSPYTQLHTLLWSVWADGINWKIRSSLWRWWRLFKERRKDEWIVRQWLLRVACQ